MSSRLALTVSVALLAGLSCLLTAYVIPVQIWALFVGWASFFAAGGDRPAFTRSVLMNVCGVFSATGSLLLVDLLGGSPWAVAACVVVGAGVLVIVGDIPILSFTPAGFLGFASTVGTIGATATAITDPITFEHPALSAAIALLLGALFGLASVALSTALTRREPATT